MIPFIALWTFLILHYGARRHGVLERGSVLMHHSYAVRIPCRKRTEPSLLLFRKSRLLTREDHVVTLLCVRRKCCAAATELSGHLQGSLREQSSLLPEREELGKCLSSQLSLGICNTPCSLSIPVEVEGKRQQRKRRFLGSHRAGCDSGRKRSFRSVDLGSPCASPPQDGVAWWSLSLYLGKLGNVFLLHLPPPSVPPPPGHKN